MREIRKQLRHNLSYCVEFRAEIKPWRLSKRASASRPKRVNRGEKDENPKARPRSDDSRARRECGLENRYASPSSVCGAVPTIRYVPTSPAGMYLFLRPPPFFSPLSFSVISFPAHLLARFWSWKERRSISAIISCQVTPAVDDDSSRRGGGRWRGGGGERKEKGRRNEGRVHVT